MTCKQPQRYLNLQHETDKHARGNDQSEPKSQEGQGAEEAIHGGVGLGVEPNDGNGDCNPHDSEQMNHQQQCEKEDLQLLND